MPNHRYSGNAGRHSSRRATSNLPSIDAAAIKNDVIGGDPSKIDTGAEQVAQAIVQKDLKTNQIRNFYGSIAKLQSDGDFAKQRRQLALLRARLAYLTARAKGAANDLWAVFDPLLKEAKSPEHVAAVCDFAEAIVAYHKYYEWQKSKKGGPHDRED